ncbi:MAG: HIG1 domain-containing protein [Sphingomonadales bacterium]|nr:HIG1 domain-containing protein [Sphingomonadaceae bacterium]MBS3931923.1 HIG1 domain-containing protein [Sphingomonadales bacterium]
MNTFLILVIIALIAMTVVTLVRGIAAFLQSTREDLERPESSGPSAMQLKQNKLMFRRIMFQAAAIGVVAILLSMSQK